MMSKLSSFFEKKSVWFGALIVLSCCLSAFFKYENTWDLINYHYYSGFSFVTGRTGYDLAPAIHHSYFNPLLDSVTYLMMTALNDFPTLYYFLTGVPFGLCLVVFLQIVGLFFDLSSAFGRKSAAFCLLIAVTGYAFFFQIGSSTHEITIALFVLTAVYLLLKAIFFTDKAVLVPFLTAGFIFGAAAGLKMSAIQYCVVSGACLLIFFKKLPRPYAQIALFITGGLTGFLATEGFWAYKMYALFQNPMPPFYNNIFKSPYFEDYNYSTTVFTSERSFWDILFLPFSFIYYNGFAKTELSSFTEFRWALAFLLACAVIGRMIFKKRLPPLDATTFVALFVLLSYGLWAFLLPVMRYTTAFEMLLAILFVKAYNGFVSDNPFFKTVVAGICLGLFVSTPLLSVPHWPSNNGAKILDFEELNLPENSLVYLVGDPMSAFVAAEARDKNIRSVTVSALTPIAFRFPESGALNKKREEIIKNHQGTEAALIRTDFFDMWEMPPIAWKIGQQSACRPYRHPLPRTNILFCVPKNGGRYVLFDD